MFSHSTDIDSDLLQQQQQLCITSLTSQGSSHQVTLHSVCICVCLGYRGSSQIFMLNGKSCVCVCVCVYACLKTQQLGLFQFINSLSEDGSWFVTVPSSRMCLHCVLTNKKLSLEVSVSTANMDQLLRVTSIQKLLCARTASRK